MQYDAIVIGAGHNGLVTAGYLAREGLKVGVFEARPIVGGAAVTEELWPGYKISRLSYVNSLFQPAIVKDFDLARFGFKMLPRDPSSFTPFPDGRYLLLGPDAALNAEQIAKFSPRDALAYPKYEAFLTDVAELLEPLMQMVPLNPSKIRFTDLAQYGSFGLKNFSRFRDRWPDIVRLLTGSANDLLNEWFESDELKATLATDAVIGANASPSQPGTAYILFHHVMGECNGVRGVWGYMQGGMGAITQSLAASIRELGVDIHTDSPVARIQVNEGRACGVILQGGREYQSRVVISGADPRMTFTRLLEESDLPEDFRKRVSRINYDSASVKINLALSELPNFKACPGTDPGLQHRGTIHLCPSTQYLEEAYADSLCGRPSRSPILECTIPSVVDPTIAPPGRHVMNIFSQYGPYALRNGRTWEESRAEYAERCIEILNEYAPNFRASILHMEVLTPVDMEREFHLTGGSISHGRMSLDQMFNLRPVAGYADYHTPVRGLFTCSAANHPGGGVMGTAGRNASREILREWSRLPH